MLPGGLIDTGKGGDKDTASGPIIEKMQQRSAKGHKSETAALPKFHNFTALMSVHSLCGFLPYMPNGVVFLDTMFAMMLSQTKRR
jgi:hypothetical protein